MAERSEADWKFLVNEGHEILKGVARDGALTNYGDLNKGLMDATGLQGFELATDQGRGEMVSSWAGSQSRTGRAPWA